MARALLTQNVCAAARYPRPTEMFGQFSQAHHMGANGQYKALGLHGTADRSDHPDRLWLPTHPGGLPILPVGMVNITPKAGPVRSKSFRRRSA